MRVSRRALLSFWSLALAAGAAVGLPACASAPGALRPPIDITIVKDSSKIGYSFLAYLDLWVTELPPLTDPSLDVYLCWKRADFSVPDFDLDPCPFHPGYVCKAWKPVSWEYTGGPWQWDEEVEFLRRPGSQPPRAVHAHVTLAGDPSVDQDPQDDRIHDP